MDLTFELVMGGYDIHEEVRRECVKSGVSGSDQEGWNVCYKNIPSLLDLTRILKSYHKRNGRRKFLEKQEQPIPCEINLAVQKWENTFQ